MKQRCKMFFRSHLFLLVRIELDSSHCFLLMAYILDMPLKSRKNFSWILMMISPPKKLLLSHQLVVGKLMVSWMVVVITAIEVTLNALWKNFWSNASTQQNKKLQCCQTFSKVVKISILLYRELLKSEVQCSISLMNNFKNRKCVSI